jgi:hypothetical protein
MSPRAKPQTLVEYYYRIGIIGGPSSGKTCLLASLAMAHILHESGLTASQMPLAPGSPKDHVDGWKWLEDCQNKIRAGQAPPPNNSTVEGLTLCFRFTDGEKSAHHVLIRDYSGELMDGNASESDIAMRLRRHMGDMDALLVVAEHPIRRLDDEDSPESQLIVETESKLVRAIERLKTAFTQVSWEHHQRGNLRTIPIALLVNKWDRTGRLDQRQANHQSVATDASEDAAVSAFFSGYDISVPPGSKHDLTDLSRAKCGPQPYHAALMAELRAASNDHFKAFAISAFGPSDTVIDTRAGTIDEAPKAKDILWSFGLERPWMWAMEERDRLDLQQLQARSTLKNILWHPGHANRSRKDAKSLLCRLSPGSPIHAPARVIQRRVRWVDFTQITCSLIAGLLLVLVVEAGIDFRNHQRAIDQITSTASKGPDRQIGIQWFRDYLSARPWQHLIYSWRYLDPEQARDELRRHLELAETRAWDAIAAAQQDQQIPLAQEYLSEYGFPNGPHRADALRILEESQWREEITRLKSDLETLQTDLSGLKVKVVADNVAALATVKVQLDTFLGKIGHPELVNRLVKVKARDANLSARHENLRNECTGLISKLIDMMGVEGIRKQLKDLWTNEDLIETAKLLLTSETQRPEFEKERELFAREGVTRFLAKFNRLLKGGPGYADALALLAEASVELPNKQGLPLAAVAPNESKNNGTQVPFDWPANLKAMRLKAIDQGEAHFWYQLGRGESISALQNYADQFLPFAKEAPENSDLRQRLTSRPAEATRLKNFLQMAEQVQQVRVELQGMTIAPEIRASGDVGQLWIRWNVRIERDERSVNTRLSPGYSSDWSNSSLSSAPYPVVTGNSYATIFERIRPATLMSLKVTLLDDEGFDDDFGSFSINDENLVRLPDGLLSGTTAGGDGGGKYSGSTLTFRISVYRDGIWVPLVRPSLSH